jgi:DNA mismatch repair protein MutS2
MSKNITVISRQKLDEGATNMDDHVLRVLEYDKIIRMLSRHTVTVLGREIAETTIPKTDLQTVMQELEETDEGATVYRVKGVIPFGGIHDIRPALGRSKIGAMLQPDELLGIAETIQSGRRLKRFLQQTTENHPIPRLVGYAEELAGLKELEEEIRRCVDDQGEIVDDASESLRHIRSEIRTLQNRLREKLDGILRAPQYQKMLQEPIITLRNDRHCVPIKAEYRGAFPGIVHDASASGATLFVEPAIVVQISNQIREKQVEEQREIERILHQLSALVADKTDELSHNVTILAHLDFVFAKAKLAAEMKAVRPKIVDDGQIYLKKARHPLLKRETAVPISVPLGSDYNLLVITGPNTGGKTVTLKTIGLLTLMAMAGLFVPAEEGTQISVFDRVCADIGDEQSIEQNLSTFSSHMRHIVRILETADARSLVLLDELGAGTDPTEGAALAMAILDFLYKKGVRTVATTHYSELKAYAYTHEGAMNASVEFDVQSLRPTYRLLVGVPGRSNAFSIARRLGLREDIIEMAQGKLTREDTKVEDLIRQLEVAKAQAERDEKEAAAFKREVEVLQNQLREEQQRWEQERERLFAKAEEEARQIVKKAQREAQTILEELRRFAKEEQASIKEHKLIELQTKLRQATPDRIRPLQPKARVANSTAQKSLRPGDTVMFLPLGQKAQVVEVQGQDLVIQIGAMKSKATIEQVEYLGSSSSPSETRNVGMLKRATQTVSLELDIRGLTVDEAIPKIDKYLDDAVMNRYTQVHIIHGKGTGALRTGVRSYLKQHPHVASFRFGTYHEGGDGVSVVELKS